MDTKTTLVQRPMGPRSINRSGSPLPPMSVSGSDPSTPRRAFGARPKLSVSTPLVQTEPPPAGRPSLSLSTQPIQPEHTRTIAPAPPGPPSLSLSIPRPPNSKPSAPKIKLQINAAATGGSLFESYAGGPGGQMLQTEIKTEERTIRPESVTLMPAHKQTTAFDNLRELVTELEAVRTGAPPPSHSHSRPVLPEEFSDAVFEELAHLGEGAGGAVHKVRHKPTGMIMARKVITALEAPRKQLERELQIVASAQHINIIKWHGTYLTSSSEIKILMEYCEGGSLETVGKRMKESGSVVGEKISGRITEGILQGLAYLYSKKIIHRDIKPSNVLLTREGVVKVCDFGVSGELINSKAGTFTGTSIYMAPERICGQEYSIRSDVWSTGITLLELAQRRFPFPPDLPAIELMMYITTGEPPELEDEDGVYWSAEMKDFIKQTLIVDAAKRPAPKDMLAHPWIVLVMRQEVNMARWMRQLYGWPKPARRSRDETSLSRPGTGRSDHF